MSHHGHHDEQAGAETLVAYRGDGPIPSDEVQEAAGDA